MDREDIIKLAREAGFKVDWQHADVAEIKAKRYEYFAALVAAAERELPKREWVGLTDEEIHDLSYLSQKIDASNSEWFDRWGFARAIEQALKDKNT